MNFGQDTSCPDLEFSWLFSVPPGTSLDSTSSRPRLFVSRPRRRIAQSVERLAMGWTVRDSRPDRDKTVHSGCGLTQSPIQWAPGGSAEGKAAGAELTIAEVKN